MSSCTTTSPHSHQPPAVQSNAAGDRQDWWNRYRAALRDRDAAEQTLCLTHLALYFPEALRAISKLTVQSTVRAARGLADGDAYHSLLQALFDAHFTLDDGMEPSSYWRDLARTDLERNERDAAVMALRRITSMNVLIEIRVDNRYSALRTQLGAVIDIDAAGASEQAAFGNLVQAHPDKLRPVEDLTYVLLETQHYQDALQLLDEAIARIRSQPNGADAYTDQTEEYSWLLNRRSSVLFRLSRMDDSVADQLAASQILDHGRSNVSQIINLAERYNDLGRPSDARAALLRVDRSLTSPFGLMQLEHERLRAALQLDDQAEAAGALAYLREHQADAISTYESALVGAGRLEEAQGLLLARLADPEQRGAALMEVQRYAEFPVPPPLAHEFEQWHALHQRPAVMAAVAKVGTIESFNIVVPGL